MSLRPFASALRHVASPIATSSRIGLDFVRPLSTSASVSARPKSKTVAPTTRWAPLSPDPFRTATGQADRAPTHTLTITSTRNNVLLTFSDAVGPLFPTITGGSDKVFKKSQRSSYEAAHQAALKMFARITDSARDVADARTDRMWIRVAYAGMSGQGREAVHAALAGPDGAEVRPLVARVEDRTAIKIGGTRARKARRL